MLHRSEQVTPSLNKSQTENQCPSQHCQWSISLNPRRNHCACLNEPWLWSYGVNVGACYNYKPNYPQRLQTVQQNVKLL